jgi:starch-binding outer membrane protein, SusD/RagB family
MWRRIMKNTRSKKTKLLFVGIFLFSACDMITTTSFMEDPETIDITVDDIFSERTSAESFLWEVYRTTVPSGFSYNWTVHTGMYSSMLMAASDEGDVYDAWPSSNAHNTGNWGPTDSQMGQENNFGMNWKGIRNVNIFIENIDNVPDIPEAEKEQMKAEARVLRGLVYQEMLKRYGALPIVDEVLVATGDILLPRATYEETVEFIVQDAAEAAAILPDSYSSSQTGRITRGAALALKGRVLLFAASPLSNTNSPYMPEHSELTGYGNYDASRWQRAADANRAVLDWAEEGNASLVTESSDPRENYFIAIEHKDNSEMILANQAYGWWDQWWPEFGQFTMPRGIYGGWYGHGVTLNHAKKYWTADGEDQEWPDEGPYDEFIEKMEEMEPRFQYSVYYSGSAFDDQYGVRNMYTSSEGTGMNGEPFNGVGYMRKFLAGRTGGGGQQNWPVFRLAEFYLNYAEALNEVSPLDPDVFWALNRVRERAGLPQVSENDPGYSDQDELRESIRRERGVELAFEEHRFFDVRRWMIAEEEGVMVGDMWGINIYELPDGTIEYRKEVFEQRVFQRHMYFYPFPQEEINKGYLIQNPGW